MVILADDRRGLGPLTGIVSALRWSPTPLVVMLAIDLPCMAAPFLQTLLNRARPEKGVIPRGDFYEPLAAVYPRAALGLAERHRASGNRSLQRWIEACRAADLVEAYPISKDEQGLFANLNTPEDLRNIE
jgi:molybdopterin-guanine dinucleotide biosynthesis protein A